MSFSLIAWAQQIDYVDFCPFNRLHFMTHVEPRVHVQNSLLILFLCHLSDKFICNHATRLFFQGSSWCWEKVSWHRSGKTMTCLWQIHQYWDEGLKVVYESFAGFSLSFLFWKKLQNQISCIKSSWGRKEKEKKVEMVSQYKIVLDINLVCWVLFPFCYESMWLDRFFLLPFLLKIVFFFRWFSNKIK